MKTTIYVLTHKKFDYVDDDLHKPILNGSSSHDEDFGYIRDDSGDNISHLNKYYAELTGQYWAWKHSKSDIIGFCHYRRYFVKDLISLKKIEKNEIESILEEYDIIMPQKVYHNVTNIEEIIIGHDSGLGTCQDEDDYKLLRKIIEEKTPEYLESFDKVLNSKECYWFNMYIAKKELLDDYFNWAFDILDECLKRTDLSKFDENNTRFLGYLSERLINVYIDYNDLKVKEKYLLHTENFSSRIQNIAYKFPNLNKILLYLYKIIKDGHYEF